VEDSKAARGEGAGSMRAPTHPSTHPRVQGYARLKMLAGDGLCGANKVAVGRCCRQAVWRMQWAPAGDPSASLCVPPCSPHCLPCCPTCVACHSCKLLLSTSSSASLPPLKLPHSCMKVTEQVYATICILPLPAVRVLPSRQLNVSRPSGPPLACQPRSRQPAGAWANIDNCSSGQQGNTVSLLALL